MKTRCPSCGATLSLDALLAHDGAREAVMVAFRLSGALGSALIRYLALFRPAARELTLDRVSRLVNELLPDLQAKRIQRNGQLFEAPLDAWIWAIEQVLGARESGRLTLPLKSHGYLYEVLSNWRPNVGAGICSAVPTAAPAVARQHSKTLTAIGALEERIRD